MPTLEDDFDFSTLSDEALEALLASEREKRKHMQPKKIVTKGKVQGEKRTAAKPAPAGAIEVELD